MVNLPPPEPNDRQSPNRLRDSDEAIAVAIAFLSVGTILWWGWTRGQRLLAPPANLPSLSGQTAEENEPIMGLDEDASDRPLERSTRGFPFLGNNTSPQSREADASPATERADKPQDPANAPARTRQNRPAATPLPADGAIAPEDAAAPTTVAPNVVGSDSEPDAEGSTLPTATSETETPPPLDISDVSPDYWAYPYIVSLYEKGLLPDLPSGQLQPDNELTRAEFAALLNSSFVQGEQPKRALSFSDIANDYWAAPAIDQVVKAGYMTGFPEGTFQPNDVVPRYQVFVTLATGLGLPAPGDVEAALNRFQGAQDLPDWSKSQMAAAAAQGLVVNYPDPQQLEPQQPATRAEIIVVIHQALLAQGRVEPVDSPYVTSGE